MMNLILWEADMSAFPSDPEERMKLLMSMGEQVKSELDSGKTKMWGVSVGGGKVFPFTREILKRYLRLQQNECPMLSLRSNQCLQLMKLWIP